MACLSFLALTLWYLGYPDQARIRSEEAMALARVRQGRDGSEDALAELARVYEGFGEGLETHDLNDAAVLLRRPRSTSVSGHFRNS